MDFGRVWGGFWEGFGRGLEALGVSWVTFWRHFLKLVFRTLSKRALGGFWAPFGLHFEGSGKGLGRILEGFGENFGAIWRIKNLIFRIAFCKIIWAFAKVRSRAFATVRFAW